MINRIPLLIVLAMLAIIAVVMLSRLAGGGPGPVAADPRAIRLAQCQAAIRAKLPDPAGADMPDYLVKPQDFLSDVAGSETTETFAFTLGGGGLRNAYCTFDPTGKLIAATNS